MYLSKLCFSFGALFHDMRTVRINLRNFSCVGINLRMVRNICVGIASVDFSIILETNDRLEVISVWLEAVLYSLAFWPAP